MILVTNTNQEHNQDRGSSKQEDTPWCVKCVCTFLNVLQSLGCQYETIEIQTPHFEHSFGLYGSSQSEFSSSPPPFLEASV